MPSHSSHPYQVRYTTTTTPTTQPQYQQAQQLPAGLTQSDLATLHQHQSIVQSQAAAAGHHGPSSSSSRAPSVSTSASSQQGRLLLDPTSLTLLSRHFDRIMSAISIRLETLNAATEAFTTRQQSRSNRDAIARADAEIARFRAILQQIDELEREFDKIARLREIVRSWRSRVEGLERRLGSVYC